MAALQHLHSSAVAGAQAAYAFVVRELDEHLPFVKQYIADTVGKAEALYTSHVAAWVRGGPLWSVDEKNYHDEKGGCTDEGRVHR